MTLALYVTTDRRFRLDVQADEQSTSLPAAVITRIERAFRGGQGAGLLHLATTEMKTDLPPTLAFARGFAMRDRKSNV